MTKKDLINEIIANENISKVECEAVVNSLFDLIIEELSSGNEVSIAGFGKFAISERAAREGINPSTGDKISIAASKSAKFKAAKQLKEKLN
ncbi:MULTISPECIES: HU family DNA-binding protein [Mesoplasma]|uniref:Predicted histone-like DNA-binding protein n=2 Tax=Mesoplasma florum TaxID=2151 RepID=Q6F1R5_MESFL|nr:MULTISPECIES: HU family DNA-binding protein [Mesoplasma]AAT75558.1 predicted histone-like DNA-binding protein [Mesoplasma florum L1]AGY41274.1 DNA-binding protein HBsu [Mesoplasma florum W37]ATI73157.1 HU family DNA-binding protein [Mesoplasma florum]ATI73844.1 HU family DNA-binding protein [Mesoplasma florum]AVN58811.1 HU family DNA-binding protein [Mesoplasma florum]